MRENGSVTQLDKTISLKLDRKTLSLHRGVIYQTKGKGLLYMSVQSVQLDGALRRVQYDLLQYHRIDLTHSWTSQMKNSYVQGLCSNMHLAVPTVR